MAGAKAENFAVVERFARQAQAQGVRILAFPEMCLTGYWHARHLDRAGWESLSDPVPEGRSTQRCCQTNANSSQFGHGRRSLVGAELPPLGESGLTRGLEEIPAGEAPFSVEVVVH